MRLIDGEGVELAHDHDERPILLRAPRRRIPAIVTTYSVFPPLGSSVAVPT